VDRVIFNMAGVKIFVLGNYILLIPPDKYFETVFSVAKSYMAFRCIYSLSVAIFVHRYFTR